MDYQQPAQGICLMDDHPDYKRYYVQCKCGLRDDTVDVFVSATEDSVELELFTESCYPTNGDQPFLGRLRTAAKAFLTIIKGDELRFQSSALLEEQTAFNFAQTVLTAIKDSQKIRKKLYKLPKKKKPSVND